MLVYDDRDEQFAAAVPFLLEGPKRGERRVHVTDDSSKAEILAAMREADANAGVDEALDSGAPTFHTTQDTYCRNGSDGRLRTGRQFTFSLGLDPVRPAAPPDLD